MIKQFTSLFLLGLFGCSMIQDHALRRPDHIYPLKKELKEISGLSYIDQSKMVAIQDEKGIIYSLGIGSFEKSSKISFSKKGDYEGIATTSKRFFVLKSNGTIVSVNHLGEDKVIHRFPGKAAVEFEGICHDEINNRLLLVSKDHPSKKKNKYINIYSFDLNSNLYLLKPIIKLAKKEIGIYRNAGLLPSGIAINPADGYIYILASVGKKLICLDYNGKLIHYYNLDKTIYKQPEGISFSKNGELYIASEGKSGKAQIMHFTSIP